MAGVSREFFARFRATFIKQEGQFFDATGTVVPGADRFPNLDVSVGRHLLGQRCVISFDARNLLNAAFKFQDIVPAKPSFAPARQVTVRLTLVL
jgi:hypothetical protein